MEVHENPLSSYSLDEIKGLMGTQLQNDNTEWIENEDLGDLPTHFDARE